MSCQVSFNMPYMIDGTAGASFVGTGLVVDDGSTTGRGLVVVDRNTVPASLGDCVLHVGSSLEVPGTVVFVHPLHNLSVVAFNAKLLQGVPLKAATLAPPTPRQATAASSDRGHQGALQRLERDFLAAGIRSGSGSSQEAEARAVYKNSDAAIAAALADNGSGSESKSSEANSKSQSGKPRYSGLTLVSLLGNQRAGTQLTSKPVVQSRVSQGQPVAYSHPPRFQESNLDAFTLEGGSQVEPREGAAAR